MGFHLPTTPGSPSRTGHMQEASALRLARRYGVLCPRGLPSPLPEPPSQPAESSLRFWSPLHVSVLVSSASQDPSLPLVTTLLALLFLLSACSKLVGSWLSGPWPSVPCL